MDGERILEAEPTIGYIHRAFEKIAENRPFTKSPYRSHELLLLPINMGWWMTLEKLLMLKYLNVPNI
jgi:NADH-quinone oxidoreductase subunit D